MGPLVRSERGGGRLPSSGLGDEDPAGGAGTMRVFFRSLITTLPTRYTSNLGGIGDTFHTPVPLYISFLKFRRSPMYEKFREWEAPGSPIDGRSIDMNRSGVGSLQSPWTNSPPFQGVARVEKRLSPKCTDKVDRPLDDRDGDCFLLPYLYQTRPLKTVSEEGRRQGEQQRAETRTRGACEFRLARVGVRWSSQQAVVLLGSKQAVIGKSLAAVDNSNNNNIQHPSEPVSPLKESWGAMATTTIRRRRRKSLPTLRGDRWGLIPSSSLSPCLCYSCCTSFICCCRGQSANNTLARIPSVTPGRHDPGDGTLERYVDT